MVGLMPGLIPAFYELFVNKEDLGVWGLVRLIRMEIG